MNRLKKLWSWLCRPYWRWRMKQVWPRLVKQAARQIRDAEDKRILAEVQEMQRVWEVQPAGGEVEIVSPVWEQDVRPKYREPGMPVDNHPRLEPIIPGDPKGFNVVYPQPRRVTFNWSPGDEGRKRGW